MVDVGLSLLAVGISFLFWANFRIDRIPWELLLKGAVVIAGVRVLSFAVGRTYSGIVRFTGTEDALRIFYVLTAGEIVLALGNCVYFLFEGAFFFFF